MKKISILFLSIIAFALLFSSCYRDSEEGLYRFVQANCDTTNVTYSGTVSAIIAANCYSCHNTGSANSEFTNYAQVFAKADRIKGRITGQSGNIMPQTGKMDNCSINKVVAWINKGALDN
ncbi:MAG: hypothetical protein NTZ33_12195 [Bacteroidetes bacterium]|nr:hypothetical protein [Bacteroidota bacterium]